MFRRMSEVTRILEAAEHGDPKVVDELLPLVYQELLLSDWQLLQVGRKPASIVPLQ